MNKAILMSIKPEWVAKILCEEKTIEIRKKFPKDYVGWVYIYCTKAEPYLIPTSERDRAFWEERKIDIGTALNGKVVARFWCDKVEEIEIKQQRGWNYPTDDTIFETKTLNPIELLEKSCLSYNKLNNYLDNEGYAIHITKLEIFDEPKKLKRFVYYSKGNGSWCSWLNCIYLDHTKEECENCKDIHLQKAPQSWCYIEENLR